MRTQQAGATYKPGKWPSLDVQLAITFILGFSASIPVSNKFLLSHVVNGTLLEQPKGQDSRLIASHSLFSWGPTFHLSWAGVKLVLLLSSGGLKEATRVREVEVLQCLGSKPGTKVRSGISEPWFSSPPLKLPHLPSLAGVPGE
jgi:hypothetical protein